MYGLAVLCSKSGNLWYHKTFKQGWGLQAEALESLLLGGITYTLWCSYDDLYNEDIQDNNFVVDFPKKQTRIYCALFDDDVWMVSMHTSISTDFAKHIISRTKKLWDSIQDASSVIGNNAIIESASNLTISKADEEKREAGVGLHWARGVLRKRTLKKGFLDLIKTDVRALLSRQCESIGGVQCLVVWDKIISNFSETFHRKNNVLKKLCPCIPWKEIRTRCYTGRSKEQMTQFLNYGIKLYIDLRASPEVNIPWQFQTLILKQVLPGINFEEVKKSSKNREHSSSTKDPRGYLYNLLTNVKRRTVLEQEENACYNYIWTIMMGDLLIFIAVKESTDINTFVSQNWTELNELGTLLKFTMIRSR